MQTGLGRGGTQFLVFPYLQGQRQGPCCPGVLRHLPWCSFPQVVSRPQATARDMKASSLPTRHLLLLSLSPFFPFSLPSPTYSISPPPLTQSLGTKRTGEPPTLYGLGRGLCPLGIHVFVRRSRKLDYVLGTEPQTDLVDVLTQGPTVLPAHIGWRLGAPTDPRLHSQAVQPLKSALFVFSFCSLAHRRNAVANPSC